MSLPTRLKFLGSDDEILEETFVNVGWLTEDQLEEIESTSQEYKDFIKFHTKTLH